MHRAIIPHLPTLIFGKILGVRISFHLDVRVPEEPESSPVENTRRQGLRRIFAKIFPDSQEGMFDRLYPFLEWRNLQGEKYLFRQGDPEQSLFILVSGRLQVSVRDKGKSKVIGEIPAGETVGEMAFFTNELRSADVRAIRDSVLVEISPDAFQQIGLTDPALLTGITKLIINRLKASNLRDAHENRVSNVAVVAISRSVDIAAFVNQLREAMQTYGSVACISSETITKSLPANSLEQGDASGLSQWLNEKEAEFEFVIYQADRPPTDWSKRCLRQADHILLVGHAKDPLEKNSIVASLLNQNPITSASRALVLLHPDKEERFQQTSNWLNSSQYVRHHHIRSGHSGDLRRLARFLTGNAVGLVLAGGGAKGLAHVGVYKALVEQGIEIDMVGGTSAGAIVAGVIAMGWTPDRIEGVCRKNFMGNPTPWSDYNPIPLLSLFKGKKLNLLLGQVFGELQIEDLLLNFFCVSSNFTQNLPQIHAQGDLYTSIRASISLPGVFPPVLFGNDLLVDGGVFNNLPIDVMRDRGAGRIIAVDFDMDLSEENKVEKVPTNWQMLRRKFIGGGDKRIPNLITAIIKSTTMTSRSRTLRTRRDVDLLFNPDLRQFGLMEWQSYDDIVLTGYDHASQVLGDWNGFA